MSHKFTQSHRDAAQQLVSQFTSREVLALLAEQENIHLHTLEDAKSHPMKDHVVDKFASLADHLLDGGGRHDHQELGRALVVDLLARTQSSDFMDNLIHYVKACLKSTGVVTPLPGGGVTTSAAAPATRSITDVDI